MTQKDNSDEAVRRLMADEGLTYEEARQKLVKILAIALVAAKHADDEAAEAAFAETRAKRERQKLN